MDSTQKKPSGNVSCEVSYLKQIMFLLCRWSQRLEIFLINFFCLVLRRITSRRRILETQACCNLCQCLNVNTDSSISLPELLPLSCPKGLEHLLLRPILDTTRAVKASECVLTMANTGQDCEKQEREQEREISDQHSVTLDLESLVLDQDPGASTSSPSMPSASALSWYHSARIQCMIEHRGEFISEAESEIESSRVHWSERDPTSNTQSETRDSRKVNRKYFKKLKRMERRTFRHEAEEGLVSEEEEDPWIRRRDPESLSGKILNWIERIGTRIGAKIGSVALLYVCYGEISMAGSCVPLFREMDDLVVGNKIAEGGQAEIYEASRDRNDGRDGGDTFVVKVFKPGFSLRDLAKRFPPALLNTFPYGEIMSESYGRTRYLWGATLLNDERFRGRFAFVIWRSWGDLRKLIDRQMMQSHNQGAPFTTQQVLHIMLDIARDMCDLHMQEPPILHRDLKAANVLVDGKNCPCLEGIGSYQVSVADYECSVGVVGTGFWRAPEVLQQLKNRASCSKLEFTKKCDVYSFGMTSYELVTGRIPFEDHSSADFDVVLSGNRPELPPNLDSFLEAIITSCWHSSPSERPTFRDVKSKILDHLGYKTFSSFNQSRFS